MPKRTLTDVNAHFRALLALLVFAGYCAGLCAFNGDFWWGWFILYPIGVWIYLAIYNNETSRS